MVSAQCLGEQTGAEESSQPQGVPTYGGEVMDDYTKDCGDHSCILRDRTKPDGMRTQGGCAHYKHAGPEANAQLRALGAEIVRLRRDHGVVIHALLRRLGADDVTLTHDEVMAAAEESMRRDVFIAEEHDKILTGTVRVYSALRFRGGR